MFFQRDIFNDMAVGYIAINHTPTEFQNLNPHKFNFDSSNNTISK